MKAREQFYGNSVWVIDGTNNELQTARISDGGVVATSGRPGCDADAFHWVHAATFDSRGNFYMGEVDTGKRLQKWVSARQGQ